MNVSVHSTVKLVVLTEHLTHNFMACSKYFTLIFVVRFQVMTESAIITTATATWSKLEHFKCYF